MDDNLRWWAHALAVAGAAFFLFLLGIVLIAGLAIWIDGTCS